MACIETLAPFVQYFSRTKDIFFRVIENVIVFFFLERPMSDLDGQFVASEIFFFSFLFLN